MNWNGLDPYGDSGEIGTVFTMPRTTPTEEKKIYKELIGLYQGVAGETGQCFDSFIWTFINKSLDSLVNKGYKDYEKFKVDPIKFAGKELMVWPSIRSRIMSILQRMSQDFDYGDPSYEIHANLPKNGTQITNQTNANSSQEISQNIELTINQRINLVVNEIEKNLTEEQLNILKNDIENYKQKPTRSATENLIKKILDLGKDVSIGVLANIISKQMGL